MWRRSIVSLLVTCAAFFYLGWSPEEALAQFDETARAIAMERAVGLKDVAAMWTTKPVPVRLLGVQVPDTVEVGESGSFAALANVGKATLPIRCQWDFGDGTTAYGLHALHHFSEPGTHSVTLRLWNEHGDVRERFPVIVVPPLR